MKREEEEEEEEGEEEVSGRGKEMIKNKKRSIYTSANGNVIFLCIFVEQVE